MQLPVEATQGFVPIRAPAPAGAAIVPMLPAGPGKVLHGDRRAGREPHGAPLPS